MKNLDKTSLWLIIVSIIVIIALSIQLSINTSKLDTEINKVKEKVGKRIVIQKDTLMIIDYSILNNNYTLEDGRKVSFDLLNKLKEVK